MSFITVGTNFKHSPIKFRERIAFLKNRINDAVRLLLEDVSLKSAVILSTCNRVEIYATCPDEYRGLNSIHDFLSIYHEINKEKIAPYLYKYVDTDAARHLLRVASGLDSQVLGEEQVLEQVARAYEVAKSFNATDALTEYIFNGALRSAKYVRENINISSANLSIADIALSIIKRETKELKDRKALIIGLGKISEMAANKLSVEGVSTIFVSNRTYEKAKEIALDIGGEAVRFDALKDRLKEADIIISATSSPHVIIKKKDLIGINKPLLIIDLAVPRDIDPAVSELEGIKLFNLDDLGSIKGDDIGQKIEKANFIIDREADRLWREFTESELEPAPLH